MSGREPLLLATCGGWSPHPWTEVAFSPLQRFALELTGVTGRRPRVLFVNTASGDQRADESRELVAAAAAGADASHLRFFGRNVPDLAEAVAAADLVWVGGGSVVNLLAVWRAHGADRVLAQAWRDGGVLAGTSAGALCWYAGGPTSSFGPELHVEEHGLGLVPASLAVHYDSQPGRRPLFHTAVAQGRLPAGYGVDEGVGLLYRGAELGGAVPEVVAEGDGSAWHVEPADGVAHEERLVPRRLS